VSEPGGAELASRRIVALGAGIVTIVVAVVTPRVVGRVGDSTLPGWYFVIIAITIAAIVLTGLAAPWAGPRMLRIGAAIGTGGYALFVLGFAPAAMDASSSVDRIPWMLSAVGVASAVALLAGGVTLATATIVFGAGSALLYRFMFGGLDLDGFVNDTQSLLNAVMICALGAHLFAVSRELDRARAAAEDATARAATERGRLAARTRAAALVHDEVLATLTLAASSLPIPRAAIARQAERAAGLVKDVDREGASPIGPLRVALARAAREAGAGFEARITDSVDLSSAAEDALLAATRQALENSVRHAGDGVDRRVYLRIANGAVRVEVVDDGRGFDPGRIAQDRLGVTTGILRRLRDVPGGTADVSSAPGMGTRVSLAWTAPPDPETAAPDVRSPRRAIAVVVAVFVAGQGLAALAAALTSSLWWAPPLLYLLLLAVADGVRRSVRARPSLARGWLLAAAVVAIVVAGACVVPFTYGELWFVGAGAFVFAALALVGRPLVAASAQVVVSVAVIAVAIARAAPTETIGHVLTRPLLVVAIAVALVFVIGRLRTRRAFLHGRALAESGRLAWDAAARAELAVRATALRAAVMPLLDRLRGDAPLTAEDRRACLTIEGQLRDEYRAGALVREPLSAAVRAARMRGIDVVLLDDGDGSASDAVMDEIAAWMAALVGTARTSVVGRMLPPGRAALATVVRDDEETTLFRGPRPVADEKPIPSVVTEAP
jgi:signal transduction histidine kinase